MQQRIDPEHFFSKKASFLGLILQYKVGLDVISTLIHV